MLFAGGEEMRGYPTVASIIANPSALAIPQIILAILPLVFTFVIVLVSIYAEGVKAEIPIAFDKVRGFGSRFPVKLLYVSVLPVILASALLANVSLIGRMAFGGVSCYADQTTFMHYLGCTGAGGYLEDGFFYLLTSFANPLFVGGYSGYFAILAGSTPLFHIPQVLHILVYAIIYISMCVFFGKFWIDVAGMSAADIANQLTQTGLQIPGFRRDPRIIQQILEKYINTIALLGSIFVGCLAVFADLTGAVGGGTGILLTVGIVYKFYDDYKKHKVTEGSGGLGSILGF
jgi:preprotein translocase subunit SecY